MAFRRKRKTPRPNQPTALPQVANFSEQEKESCFIDTIKRFDFEKYDKVTWNVFSCDYLAKGLKGEQIPVTFIDANSTTVSLTTNSFEEKREILIGRLEITGNFDGISDILSSGCASKKSLHWSMEEQLLCIWVTTSPLFLNSSVNVDYVLSTPITICHLVDYTSKGMAELGSMVRRGSIRVVCTPIYTTEHYSCRSVGVAIFATERVINVGVADILPASRNGVKGSVMKLFHDCSTDSRADLQLQHSEVIIDPEDISSKGSVKSKIFQFYNWVHSYQSTIHLTEGLSPLPPSTPGLTASLHNYQVKAVQWMLSMEHAEGWISERENERQLHPLWEELTVDDKSFYYNCFTDKVSHERFPSPTSVKGGILADEMGLGKTVEVLALILIHKWTPPPETTPSFAAGATPLNGVEQSTTESQPLVEINKIETSLSDTRMEESKSQSIGIKQMETTSPIPESTVPSNQSSIVMQHDSNDQQAIEVAANGNVGLDNADTEGDILIIDGQNEGNCSNQQQNQAEATNGSATTESDEPDIWCLCGAYSDTKDSREFVQCTKCAVWQHSKCANYDSSKNEDFVCVRCLLKQPISCGTTLVIVPSSLLNQWLEEITKHTDVEALRVMVYWGVARRYINPLHIISHDIVMVTYETLRSELNRVHHHEYNRMLRKRKKWSYPPSPLLAINWWRVCLDEAQVVESVNAKAAEMTHKLTAVNRWCITGTPVQRDLRDLFGLVYFLGYRPYCINQWWHQLIWRPFCTSNPRPMVALFSNLMWRNSKDDVADELHLPKMTEQTHWLTFSAVEEYFYKKQEKLCQTDFLKAVASLSSDFSDYSLSEIHRSTVAKLLTPLLTLRQACCHPQLIRKGYVTLGQKKKSYLTMHDLMNKLVSQAKQEGREDLRQLVAALNGQAAIHIIQENFIIAVALYREAMFAWNKHKDNFTCDRMQRIHTMENLASLLEKGHSPSSRAPSDDNLRHNASILRGEYMRNQETHVTHGVQTLSLAANAVRKTLEKMYQNQTAYLNGERSGMVQGTDHTPSHLFVPSPVMGVAPENEEEIANRNDDDDDNGLDSPSSSDVVIPMDCKCFDEDLNTSTTKTPRESWWSSVIAWAIEAKRGEELLSTLDTELQTSPDVYQQLTFFNFKELSGLNLAILSHIEKLQGLRNSVLDHVGKLSQPGPLPDELLQRASYCHLKTDKTNVNTPCDYCTTETEIRNYEGQLFARYSIGTIEDGSSASSSSRAMCVCEKLLRSMLGFVKTKGAPYSLCVAGNDLIVYFEALRKEFKHILGLWMKAEQKARACDELNMAATRLTLAEEFFSTHSHDEYMFMEKFLIDRSELGAKLLEFSSDAMLAQSKLQKSYGQLVYLQNLVRVKYQNRDGTSSGNSNGTSSCDSSKDSAAASTPEEGEGKETLTCPICTIEMEIEWSVLPCGHCLCIECLNILIKRHTGPAHHHTQINGLRSPRRSNPVNFPCPMCRVSVNSNDVHYIQTNDKAKGDEEYLNIELTGSYSTKIRAVVCTLKSIKLLDPSAKALVFSSMNEVLKIIAHALDENGIQHTFLKSRSDYKTNLKKFKTSPYLNVLLLPMMTGSKGLNITEATHLLLVEPSLNLGAELQAIGRIHRVGQTKPTTVHRFYVRKSIEESIHAMVSSSSDMSKFITCTSAISEQECNLTVSDLQSLLLTNDV